MRATTRLAQLVRRPEILLAPGVYDAYLARCVQAAGFEALYMTGAGVSHSRLGVPDLGLLTYPEMLDTAARIADATDLPLIADADTGYGNALNVARTIKGYERAGVAGCHIEDQVFPKRCGHFDRKRVIALDEMLGKLRAALDARTDPDFQIIARTDARTVDGLDAAIERARAFVEVGVDVVFVESPRSEDELARIAREVDAPLLANMVETGLTPLLPAARLEALGYAVMIHPGALGRFIGKQVGEFLARMRADGTTLPQIDRMLDFQSQNAIVDLPGHLERAARYE
ncbi:MAG: oxaloacetate decarboxylase [Ectothiorhodospiraceae bacterium]|nr:oxaloacetate decarboxylase [Chromatiales bacterium]MCP5156012.1 oxaloacetate decarboxylase [Ectothiorhodospiraceae bacterium]